MSVVVSFLRAAELRGNRIAVADCHNIRIRHVDFDIFGNLVSETGSVPKTVAAGNARRAVFGAIDGAFVVCKTYAEGQVFKLFGIVV